MLRSKEFMKVTKKGSVVKVVKEHYLRDDIYCGLPCNICLQTEHPLLLQPIIIPDTNVFMHQINILEHQSVTNVIVLQTVLDELKGNAVALYERVRSLVRNEDRHFYVFSNEHHRSTFVERNENESPNDRNDRAIRMACLWYQNHCMQQLKQDKNFVKFITDDQKSRDEACKMGINTLSTAQYISSVPNSSELADILFVPESNLEKAQEDFQYDEYALDLEHGILSGKYLKSSLNVSFFNCFEGTIFCEYKGQMTSIAISGRMNMNRAIHGDVVAVQILDEKDWIYEEAIAKDESEGAEPSHSASSALPSKIAGKVVGILEKKRRSFCGTIDKKTVGSGMGAQFVLVSPMDRRVPKIRIRTSRPHELASKRLIVQIDYWNLSSKYPFGHFCKDLGQVGLKSTETDALLIENDVPFYPFSPQVLACLPSGEWAPTDADYSSRRDLRHLSVCSIDPPGCTDIDDALHAIQLPNGNCQIGVHIADVTHFVKPGTAMDEEAAKRGTTVYLVDKRIDMLPELLGTNLCSLRSNVERFAFSVIWEVDSEANILSEWFGKSVIKSKASFTYDEAQQRLDSRDSSLLLSQEINTLNFLARKLRHRRMAAGALTLSSPEVRFQLENDSQDILDVEMKELKEANSLVEEFMLLANIQVAKKIFSHFPEVSLLRRHPIPPPDNFTVLNEMLQTRNLKIDHANSRAVADSLDLCIDEKDSYFNKLIRIMATRCMMQAVYFCSGSVSPADFVHYGLATPIYTHFTSPIRRYSDVVVHRLLSACISAVSQVELSKQKIVELTDNLNYRHRMAQQAARSSVELYTCLFFEGKSVEEVAYVVKVVKNGLVVFIPKYGIEQVIHLDDFLNILDFDPVSFSFSINNKPFVQIFQKVQVKLALGDDIDLSRRKMRVSLVSPVLPAAAEKKSKSMKLE